MLYKKLVIEFYLRRQLSGSPKLTSFLFCDECLLAFPFFASPEDFYSQRSALLPRKVTTRTEEWLMGFLMANTPPFDSLYFSSEGWTMLEPIFRLRRILFFTRFRCYPSNFIISNSFFFNPFLNFSVFSRESLIKSWPVSVFLPDFLSITAILSVQL